MEFHVFCQIWFSLDRIDRRNGCSYLEPTDLCNVYDLATYKKMVKSKIIIQKLRFWSYFLLASSATLNLLRWYQRKNSPISDIITPVILIPYQCLILNIRDHKVRKISSWIGQFECRLIGQVTEKVFTIIYQGLVIPV